MYACSKVVYGMTLGYPTNGKVLGFQGHRLGLRLQITIRVKATAIWCGFELIYECLLVVISNAALSF